VGFVARVAELNAIRDGARLKDFTVANENRSLSEVAHAFQSWMDSKLSRRTARTALPLR